MDTPMNDPHLVVSLASESQWTTANQSGRNMTGATVDDMVVESFGHVPSDVDRRDTELGELARRGREVAEVIALHPTVVAVGPQLAVLRQFDPRSRAFLWAAFVPDVDSCGFDQIDISHPGYIVLGDSQTRCGMVYWYAANLGVVMGPPYAIPEHLIQMLLREGGVEINPGPKKAATARTRADEFRKFKERRAAKRSPRQVGRKEKQIELVRAGIEENPGPSGKTGSPAAFWRKGAVKIVAAAGAAASATAEAKVDAPVPSMHLESKGCAPLKPLKRAPRELKKPASIKGTAMTALVEELKVESEKLAGVRDAEAEVEVVKKDELLQMQRKILERDIVDLESTWKQLLEFIHNGLPECCCFINCDWKSAKPQFTGVSDSEAALDTRVLGFIPVPLHYSVATLREVRPSYAYTVRNYSVIEDGEEVERAKRVKTYGGAVSGAMYNAPKVEMSCFLAYYDVVTKDQDGRELETREIAVSCEMLAAAKACHIYSSDILATLRFADSWMGRHPLYESYDLSQMCNSFLHTLVFGHLLMVDRKVLSNVLDLSGAAFASLAKEIMHNSPEPLAEGQYVAGYEVGPGDVFPKEWKTAAKSVASGACSAAEAVKEFVATVSQEGTVLKGRFSKAAARAEKRALAYARILGSGRSQLPHLKGLHTAFPNPFSKMNHLTGMLKRLMARNDAPTDEDLAYEHEISIEMAEMIRVVPNPEGAADVMKTAEEHCRLMSFSPQQREDFMTGCEKACDLCREGADAMAAFMREHGRLFQDWSAFIKKECYPVDLIKAVRYIVSPPHFQRGFLHGLFDSSGRHLVEQLKAWTVKDRNPAEVLIDMAETFSAWCGADYKFGSGDKTAFESCITITRRVMNELLALVAAAPPMFRAAMEVFIRSLENMTISGEQYEVLLAFIRASGEKVTAVGNFAENVPMTMGPLAQALGVKIHDVRRWFREWRCPFKFEGDDSLLVLPREAAEKLCAWLEKKVRTKFDTAESWLDTTFCKMTRVMTAEGFCLLADPMEVLAKLQTWMACDSSSDALDCNMLVARALSYRLRYRGLPMVETVCCAILTRYRSRVVPLISAALNGPQRNQASLFLHDFLFYERGQQRDAEAAKLLSMELVQWEESEIDDRMRAAVAEAFHISSQEQVGLESRLRFHYLSGKGPLVLSQVEHWRARAGAARCSLHEFKGTAREAAHRMMGKARSCLPRLKVTALKLVELLLGPLRFLWQVYCVLCAVAYGLGLMALVSMPVACLLPVLPFLVLIAALMAAAYTSQMSVGVKYMLGWDSRVVNICVFILLFIYNLLISIRVFLWMLSSGAQTVWKNYRILPVVWLRLVFSPDRLRECASRVVAADAMAAWIRKARSVASLVGLTASNGEGPQ